MLLNIKLFLMGKIMYLFNLIKKNIKLFFLFSSFFFSLEESFGFIAVGERLDYKLLFVEKILQMFQ